MNKRTSIVVALIGLGVLSGCAHTDEWSRADTKRQWVVTGLMAADAYTTSKIQYLDYPDESGPLARQVLGAAPKTSDTYMYFTTLAIGNYLIARALPRKWRPYWQTFLMADYAYGIRRNCLSGLC